MQHQQTWRIPGNKMNCFATKKDSAVISSAQQRNLVVVCIV